VVNVLVYHRAVATAALNEVLALKRQRPDVRLGLLALGPVNDTGEPEPTDPDGLTRLGKEADFAWSVPPPDSIAELAGIAGRVGRIRYGFSERSLGANTRPEAPLPRDIDVMFRGLTTPRRQAIWDTLAQRGVSGFWLDNASFPPYLADDLISRSKMILDFNAEPGARGRSPALSAHALHQATLIVAETAPQPGWQPEIDSLTVTAPYEALVDRCLQILNSGFHTKLGIAALQKFRAETSMRDNLKTLPGLG
jgi:hypothetical protein